MAHYYSVSGKPIELELANDDIGMRFAGAAGPGDARRAAALVRKATSGAAVPGASQFHRFVILHDSNAGAMPVGSIAGALPLRLAKRVERPLPVFIEKRSGMKLITTEEIVVRFKPKTSTAAHAKLLAGLDLTRVRTSEYDRDAHIVVPTSLRRASRALDLANQLVEADDIVDYAAPNFITEVRKHVVPRLFGQQWHLENTGQHGGLAHEDVRAAGAWALVGGGKKNIIVAVIDDRRRHRPS